MKRPTYYDPYLLSLMKRETEMSKSRPEMGTLKQSDLECEERDSDNRPQLEIQVEQNERFVGQAKNILRRLENMRGRLENVGDEEKAEADDDDLGFVPLLKRLDKSQVNIDNIFAAIRDELESIERLI